MKVILVIVLTLCFIGNLNAKRVGVGGACSTDKNCSRGLRCRDSKCVDPTVSTSTTPNINVQEPAATCPQYTVTAGINGLYGRLNNGDGENNYGWDKQDECSTSRQAEVGVKFTSTVPGYYLIQVQSDQFVPHFWVRGGATCNGGEVGSNNQLDGHYYACIEGTAYAGGGGSSEYVIYMLASQSIMIFVEGTNDNNNIFNIKVNHVNCGHKTAGFWVTEGSFNGNNELGFDRFAVPSEGTCAGATPEEQNGGREEAFSFNPSRSGNYRVSVTADFNAFVSVVQNKCGGPPLACGRVNADGTATFDVQNLTAGGVYVIVIDGAGADQAGTFDGSIELIKGPGKKRTPKVSSLRRLKKVQAQQAQQ